MSQAVKMMLVRTLGAAASRGRSRFCRATQSGRFPSPSGSWCSATQTGPGTVASWVASALVAASALPEAASAQETESL